MWPTTQPERRVPDTNGPMRDLPADTSYAARLAAGSWHDGRAVPAEDRSPAPPVPGSAKPALDTHDAAPSKEEAKAGCDDPQASEAVPGTEVEPAADDPSPATSEDSAGEGADGMAPAPTEQAAASPAPTDASGAGGSEAPTQQGPIQLAPIELAPTQLAPAQEPELLEPQSEQDSEQESASAPAPPNPTACSRPRAEQRLLALTASLPVELAEAAQRAFDCAAPVVQGWKVATRAWIASERALAATRFAETTAKALGATRAAVAKVRRAASDALGRLSARHQEGTAAVASECAAHRAQLQASHDAHQAALHAEKSAILAGADPVSAQIRAEVERGAQQAAESQAVAVEQGCRAVHEAADPLDRQVAKTMNALPTQAGQAARSDVLSLGREASNRSGTRYREAVSDACGVLDELDSAARTALDAALQRTEQLESEGIERLGATQQAAEAEIRQAESRSVEAVQRSGQAARRQARGALERHEEAAARTESEIEGAADGALVGLVSALEETFRAATETADAPEASDPVEQAKTSAAPSTEQSATERSSSEQHSPEQHSPEQHRPEQHSPAPTHQDLSPPVGRWMEWGRMVVETATSQASTICDSLRDRSALWSEGLRAARAASELALEERLAAIDAPAVRATSEFQDVVAGAEQALADDQSLLAESLVALGLAAEDHLVQQADQVSHIRDALAGLPSQLTTEASEQLQTQITTMAASWAKRYGGEVQRTKAALRAHLLRVATRLNGALGAVGDDEAGALGALAQLGSGESVAFNWLYKSVFGNSPRQLVRNNLSGSERASAEAYLSGERARGLLYELKSADGLFSVDRDWMWQSLRNAPLEVRLQLAELERVDGIVKQQLDGLRVSLAEDGGLAIFENRLRGADTTAEAYELSNHFGAMGDSAQWDAVHTILERQSVENGGAPLQALLAEFASVRKHAGHPAADATLPGVISNRPNPTTSWIEMAEPSMHLMHGIDPAITVAQARRPAQQYARALVDGDRLGAARGKLGMTLTARQSSQLDLVQASGRLWDEEQRLINEKRSGAPQAASSMSATSSARDAAIGASHRENLARLAADMGVEASQVFASIHSGRMPEDDATQVQLLLTERAPDDVDELRAVERSDQSARRTELAHFLEARSGREIAGLDAVRQERYNEPRPLGQALLEQTNGRNTDASIAVLGNDIPVSQRLEHWLHDAEEDLANIGFLTEGLGYLGLSEAPEMAARAAAVLEAVSEGIQSQGETGSADGQSDAAKALALATIDVYRGQRENLDRAEDQHAEGARQIIMTAASVTGAGAVAKLVVGLAANAIAAVERGDRVDLTSYAREQAAVFTEAILANPTEKLGGVARSASASTVSDALGRYGSGKMGQSAAWLAGEGAKQTVDAASGLATSMVAPGGGQSDRKDDSARTPGGELLRGVASGVVGAAAAKLGPTVPTGPGAAPGSVAAAKVVRNSATTVGAGATRALLNAQADGKEVDQGKLVQDTATRIVKLIPKAIVGAHRAAPDALGTVSPDAPGTVPTDAPANAHTGPTERPTANAPAEVEPAEAVPAEAVPAEAVPAKAVPAEAVPADVEQEAERAAP